METIQWKVQGMTCSNCALTVSKYLEKQGGQNVKVNPIGGDVSFDIVEAGPEQTQSIAEGIEDLGYHVMDESLAGQKTRARRNGFRNHWQRFLFCLVFTLPLLVHMLPVHIHWLMNPWLQLALCLPVYMVGMAYFGKSAVNSLRNGMPNMNVLIALGATAAFGYSLTGTLFNLGPDYQFYETAATIITLVFLGYHLEDVSVKSTQKAMDQLAARQPVMATMIAFDDQHQEVLFPVEAQHLRSGDLVLVRSGEQVPADARILWGDVQVDESLLTGESLPLHKKSKDHLIGGSVIVDGTVKAQVTAEARHSVLANILNLVKRAQGDKPPVQLLADKISAVFVPAVLVIAAATFLINWLLADAGLTASLMRSIAVLVIACPCAMGLATPAAVAVGLGRAARQGILFRHAKSLEAFKDIRQVVFDKTGTLTTGQLSVVGFEASGETEENLKRIVYSLEKYSQHPIARAIAREWKMSGDIRWQQVEEIRGAGMKARSREGDEYTAGKASLAGLSTEYNHHSVFVTKNGMLIGWVDVRDTLRPETPEVIRSLKQKGIRTILLSGDRQAACDEVARQAGIDEVYAEHTPEEKLRVIESLNRVSPVAMVGDGINDAPALAKATVGISVSNASDIAQQTADVILLKTGLQKLPLALGLGSHTYLTIKQNLFWAFLYNIIAIPVAAVGLLTPAFGALIMGFSDVVLALNSVRLFVKKVN